ncbi:hypothetical protein NC653_018792 [Populus alba x Populus x berolinensis]|uniref:Uncharacterized protein n=1 Tax=Populus alba x Populus x berolinensis TaxID=444605 RepID=A0AAD6QHA4_9ROSI|nr:hypothetical protein NC653_018792 [Populus alba x Populus x berolinensis]
MAKTYYRNVRPRTFREGDLVLRKVIPLPNEDYSKWTPNYEGLYIVKKAFSRRALILTSMDGEDVIRPVNSNSVKKYFVDAGFEHEDLDQLFEGVRSSYKATVLRVCSAGGRWHGLGGGARIQSNLFNMRPDIALSLISPSHIRR